MFNKTIKFGLSESEIDSAIKEIEKIEKDLIKKTETLKKRIAELIRDKADIGFRGSIADDITNGEQIYADVDVTVEEDGDIFVVIANGEDAVWVEFGAGVYHNGPVGSSPNPLGENLGFAIGGFGSKGGRNTWVFKDPETGERKFTHGTPANMPMYKALEEVMGDLKSIVREVWSGND